MKKLKSILTAIAIIVIGFLLFKVFSGMKKDPEPAKVFRTIKYVHTDIVHYMDHYANIHASGRLKSNYKIEVFSEVSGIAGKTNPRFKEGNSFSNNQIMIIIDDEEARFNLYSQKSDFLNLLTKTIPDIKADFPESFNKWNSYLENFTIESMIKELPKTSSAKEKYFLAARNIYKLYYAIKTLEAKLSKYNIRAPFTGVVTQSMFETGTFIRMGQKLGEFAGTNNFELELPLNENQIKYVAIGNIVELTLEGSYKEWKGKVTRISENFDPTTQTINVYVSLNGKRLYDGMYLNALIKGTKIRNAFKIPRKAIVNNNYVHTVKDSLLGKKKVNIIMIEEEFVYINGLDSLETVVTEQLVNTPVGTKIKPIKK